MCSSDLDVQKSNSSYPFFTTFTILNIGVCNSFPTLKCIWSLKPEKLLDSIFSNIIFGLIELLIVPSMAYEIVIMLSYALRA